MENLLGLSITEYLVSNVYYWRIWYLFVRGHEKKTPHLAKSVYRRWTDARSEFFARNISADKKLGAGSCSVPCNHPCGEGVVTPTPLYIHTYDISCFATIYIHRVTIYHTVLYITHQTSRCVCVRVFLNLGVYGLSPHIQCTRNEIIAGDAGNGCTLEIRAYYSIA